MLRALQALLVHERNQQGALHRAMQAKHMGVESPEQYAATFPGSTVTTNNTTTHNSGGGWLKGSLLSAALLTAGGGAALGLRGNAEPRTGGEAPPAATAPPATPPARGKEWDALYEVQQPDGSWKQVKRERLKTRE